MSAKKWKSRGPIEKGLIIGGSVIGLILTYKTYIAIDERIQVAKRTKAYKKALEKWQNDVASGQIPANTPPPNVPAVLTKKIKNFIDDIYNKVAGANIWYYPDTINKLTKYSGNDLRAINDYWNEEYYTGAGGDLKTALQNEYAYLVTQWDPTYHEYTPAIDHLTTAGY